MNAPSTHPSDQPLRQPYLVVSVLSPVLGLIVVFVAITLVSFLTGFHAPCIPQASDLHSPDTSWASFVAELRWRLTWMSLFVLFFVLVVWSLTSTWVLTSRCLRQVPQGELRWWHLLRAVVCVAVLLLVWAYVATSASGETDFAMGYSLPSRLKGTGARGPRLAISIAGSLAIPVLASTVLCLMAAIRSAAGTLLAPNISQSIGAMRHALLGSSALLTVGVVMTHVMGTWVVQTVHSDDATQNPLSELPTALSLPYGILLSTVLVATFVPAIVIVRSCATESVKRHLAPADDQVKLRERMRALGLDFAPVKDLSVVIGILAPALASLVSGPLQDLLGSQGK